MLPARKPRHEGSIMERGNEPSGGSEPSGGEEAEPSDTSGPTLVDPGPTAGGGGPSSVAGGGEAPGASDVEEYDIDMTDFDQAEYLEDGSVRAPILDDDGNIVNWVTATPMTNDQLANTPMKPGATRLFNLGGRSVAMKDDGTIVPLD
jgi:hypothetical protein